MWRGRLFSIYKRLANIFEKDRAIGKGVQNPIDMENNINMDEINEVGIDDIPFSDKCQSNHTFC